MRKKRQKVFVFVARQKDFEGNEKLPPFAMDEIKNASSKKFIAEKRACFGLLDFALNSLKIESDFSRFVKIGGKPYAPNFQFSCSHSHGLVAVAISDRDVGIDIEMFDEKKFNERLKQRICFEGETSKSGRALAKLWTRKEACFKLHGGDKFVPSEIDTKNYVFKTKMLKIDKKTYFFSVSTDKKQQIIVKNLI